MRTDREKQTLQRTLLYEMGSLFNLLFLCFSLFWLNHSSLLADSQSTKEFANFIDGNVFINGTVSIARTDDNFICATLDWWPPDKCDYGTCSWGRASVLNLVSS